MRKYVILILVTIMSPTLLTADKSHYYEMEIDTKKLETSIRLKGADVDLEEEFKKCSSLQISSKFLGLEKLKVSIVNGNDPYALGILPFAEDWKVQGCLINNQLDTRFHFKALIAQTITNIGSSSNHLSNEHTVNTMSNALILPCKDQNIRLAIDSHSTLKKIFVLATTTKSGNYRFEDQYFGDYKSIISLTCEREQLLIRYTFF